VAETLRHGALPQDSPGLQQWSSDEWSARLVCLQLEAWEALYLRHQSLIHGVLACLLGYPSDLEPMTQQVFERALALVASERVRPTDDESRMRAWLVGIALDVARIENKAHFRAAKPTEEPHANGPLLLQHAHLVLAKLPTQLQVLWLLRQFGRMTHEEIAASTGTTVNRVKQRLRRADVRFFKLAEQDPILREHLTEVVVNHETDGGDSLRIVDSSTEA